MAFIQDSSDYEVNLTPFPTLKLTLLGLESIVRGTRIVSIFWGIWADIPFREDSACRLGQTCIENGGFHDGKEFVGVLDTLAERITNKVDDTKLADLIDNDIIGDDSPYLVELKRQYNAAVESLIPELETERKNVQGLKRDIVGFD